MMDLPDGEKSLTICLPVLTECTNVTDRQTDGHRMMAKAAFDASIVRQKCTLYLEIYGICMFLTGTDTIAYYT